MLTVPSDKKALLSFALDLVEQCRVSVGARSSYYRLMNLITETGKYDGSKSLINMMYMDLTRTASHMFSPVSLKFDIDFEGKYPKNFLDRAKVVANALTRQWERSNTDMVFGRGVFESLKYGASILKQWPQVEGKDEHPTYYRKLLMPWQFGVYNENENDLDRQVAMCETTSMTMAEVWRRIYHLPDAKKLYDRINTHSQTDMGASEPQTYFHQVLSTSQLNTASQGAARPGGIVSLSNDSNFALMAPQVSAPTVQFHEIWVQDNEDYTTIQMVEPDIIIAPLYNKANLLIKDSHLHPYTLIQPNEVTNWFWGRSELVDLIEPQGLLSQWCDDIRRLFGLQIDKILGFIGENGLTDELYGQFRTAGYVNLAQGSSITDITPKMPAEALQMLEYVERIINMLAGFPPVMQGQGEQGVRAGSHANTLMKTASPTLRDRSLLVERQCAVAGDKTLSIMEAKESKKYWTKGDTIKDIEDTAFLLTDLPDDWRVVIDSHSTSPIFQDEATQLIVAARRQGDVDGEYVLDNLPFPNKEEAKAKLREKEARNAKQMQELLQTNPEVAEKVLVKQLTGGHH